MQLAMKQLSKSLVWVALFFSILIPLLGYVRGVQPNPAEAVLYGLSLAFVVIPEELPIIVTMVLGVGSYALSRKGATVKRLRVITSYSIHYTKLYDFLDAPIELFIIMFFANLIGWFYSAPPVRLISRGLGELAVAWVTGFVIPGVGYS